MEIHTDVSAERVVLAGLFQHGQDAYIDVVDFLQEDTFTDLTHQCLFKCFCHGFQVKKMSNIDKPSLLAIANVIESKFQCALMAPTEILASQHFNLAKKIFKNTKIKTSLLIGKTELIKKKQIIKDLENNKIDLIIGTHSLFQKNIKFNNLGLIIIDED